MRENAKIIEVEISVNLAIAESIGKALVRLYSIVDSQSHH
jgi:hypothetical protein